MYNIDSTKFSDIRRTKNSRYNHNQILKTEAYILLHSGEPWTMSALLDKDPNHRSIAFLDKYAQERWDTVLHYMVSLKIKSVKNWHEMDDLLKN